MIKSVSKARKRYQDQLEKTKTSEQQKSAHGGLAGRPNLSSLSASDPEILRNWKYLAACTRLVLVKCPAIVLSYHQAVKQRALFTKALQPAPAHVHRETNAR